MYSLCIHIHIINIHRTQRGIWILASSYLRKCMPYTTSVITCFCIRQEVFVFFATKKCKVIHWTGSPEVTHVMCLSEASLTGQVSQHLHINIDLIYILSTNSLTLGNFYIWHGVGNTRTYQGSAALQNAINSGTRNSTPYKDRFFFIFILDIHQQNAQINKGAN